MLATAFAVIDKTQT